MPWRGLTLRPQALGLWLPPTTQPPPGVAPPVDIPFEVEAEGALRA